MASSSSQVGLVVVAVVVGGVVGYLIGQSSAPTPQADQIVTVGPNAIDVKPPSATIGPSDHVFWRTSPTGRKLSIVFPRSGFPPSVTLPPFEGMLASGNDFSVSCAGDSCSSGQVNTKLPRGTHDYKYNQILDGVPADGHIIIRW